MLRNINCTTLTLIPMSKHHSKVGEFKPIVYCTMLYKIISKVIANRLKKVLYGIISLTQSAFIPRWHIGDNILLAYEIVKHYGRERISPRAILKVDFRKAYDSVEWPFIFHVILGLGFPHQFGNGSSNVLPLCHIVCFLIVNSYLLLMPRKGYDRAIYYLHASSLWLWNTLVEPFGNWLETLILTSFQVWKIQPYTPYFCRWTFNIC